MSQLSSTIEKEIQSIANSKDKGQKIIALLTHLNEIFHDNPNNIKLLKDVCNACIGNKFLDHFCYIWEELKCPELYDQPDSDSGMNFQLIKEVIWNYSDRCPDLCRGIYYDERIVSLLVGELEDFALHQDDLEDNYKRHHVKADFGILHNLLRHYDDTKSQIREFRGLQIVTCYTRSEFLIIQTYAFVILAFCTKADEMNTLLPGVQVFQFLHGLLKDTIESQKHMSEKYGLSAEEVVQCIAKLASSDANKKALVDTGFVDTIATMLDAKLFPVDEIYQCLDFLWKLCLNSSSNLSLQKNINLVEKIKALNGEPTAHSSVKKESASILYTLEPHSGQTQKHIMLSYQWDSQKTVKMLYNYLKDNGYHAWMDIHEMKGSIYSSMAAAVENSAVVVMAMTRKYKESEHAKKEAEYASVLKVPILPLMLEERYTPDGWLGLLLGAKLYIKVNAKDPKKDFEQVEKHLSELLKEHS